MKKILILVLLSFSLSVNAQSLNEIFLKIPDVYFKDFKEVCNDNLTLEGRKALLNNKKYKVFEIETLDSKNGYLSFFTNTDGEGMAGYLTYWRFQHSILAALVIDHNANCTDYSKDIYFFEYQNGKLVDVSKSFNPKLGIKDFNITDPQVLSTFKDNFSTIWRLPKEGKKIKIYAFHYDCGGDWYPANGIYFELEPNSSKTFKIVKSYEKNPNE